MSSPVEIIDKFGLTYKEPERKYYQPTVELFKFSLWKGKWIQKRLYPSTLIFSRKSDATRYQNDFIEGLKRRGVKLNGGNFQIHIAEIFVSNHYSI